MLDLTPMRSKKEWGFICAPFSSRRRGEEHDSREDRSSVIFEGLELQDQVEFQEFGKPKSDGMGVVALVPL